MVLGLRPYWGAMSYLCFGHKNYHELLPLTDKIATAKIYFEKTGFSQILPPDNSMGIETQNHAAYEKEQTFYFLILPSFL